MGETVVPVAARAPGWLVAVIAGGFGLFYAYLVWGAVALLIAQAGDADGLGATAWVALVLAVLFPIGVFAVALSIGWRRRARDLALLLLAGLALAAVFWVDVIAYFVALIVG